MPDNGRPHDPGTELREQLTHLDDAAFCVELADIVRLKQPYQRHIAGETRNYHASELELYKRATEPGYIPLLPPA